MDVKRFVAFLVIVALTLGVIGATTPALVKKVRLGLDLRGGFEILYVATPLDPGGKVTKNDLIATAKSLEDRINKQGVAEPDITTEGNDRIRARIAGVTDEAKVRETLKKPANLTFKGPDGKVYMDGRDFVPNAAKVEYHQNTNQPIVSIKMKDAGKFKEVTSQLVNKNLSINLDDVEISNPRVNQVIDSDSAIIEGSFTIQEANDLATTINLGALPLNLTEKYTQSVGATLGQQSLKDTIYAGAVALIFILAFMLVLYRIPGVVAVVSIIAFSWLLLLVFVLMNAALTLPGIAAFVLGIGMAVDANIITFERIKDEIRSGKSIMSSLRAGSKNSFRTIIDANLTTLIAGAALYFIGTGSIRGFALTLIFSIAVTIITNVFFSRVLLNLLIRSNVAKKPAYFGVKETEIHAL